MLGKKSGGKGFNKIFRFQWWSKYNGGIPCSTRITKHMGESPQDGPSDVFGGNSLPTNLVHPLRRSFRGRIWSNFYPFTVASKYPLKMSCLKWMWENFSVACFQFVQEKTFVNWWFSWIFSGSSGFLTHKDPTEKRRHLNEKNPINLLNVQEPRNLLNSFGSFLRGWTERHICFHGVRILAGKMLNWMHFFDETLLGERKKHFRATKNFLFKRLPASFTWCFSIAIPFKMVSKRNFLFQGATFRFHIKLWEGGVPKIAGNFEMFDGIPSDEVACTLTKFWPPRINKGLVQKIFQ